MDPGAGSEAEDQLRGRTYLSTEVTDSGAPRALVDGTRISLQFTDDGRLLANAGCNSMSGEVSLDDSRLDVGGGLATTEMGCDPARHEQDEWLAKLFDTSPEWRVDGDRLILTSGESRIVLLDRKVAQPDRPLTGTRWKLTTIIDGEVASSVPKLDKTPDLTFTKGGEVRGFSGCNGFGGEATVSGSTIAFGSLQGTLIACPGAAGEVERTVLDVLKGDVQFTIDADQLRLRHPDGKTLVYSAATAKDR
ncbi:META domain-containing protein [Actinopolymorpha sp. B17G11]|uniref:META domain-containing protein n=1 Tax=unclassified Actinopolymorpha TaxID=2627063 RepID=UPI0032D8FE33